MDKKDILKSLDIGPGLFQLTDVTTHYRKGAFENFEQAKGAFQLAYLQALDGPGKTIAEWMGLTGPEFDAWMSMDFLPPKEKHTRKKKASVELTVSSLR